MAAFFIVKMFKTCQFWECFKQCFQPIFITKTLPSLIWKIRHNFLVPRITELACKTFMPIQNLDLNRVIYHFFCFKYTEL
jgi:hypothetical protein